MDAIRVEEVDPADFGPQRAIDQWEEHQRELDEMHVSLKERRFVGHAADGMVTATVQASGAVTAVEIDPYVVQRYGVEGLGDLVMKAINDGTKQSAELMREVFAHFAPPGITVDPAEGGSSRG